MEKVILNNTRSIDFISVYDIVHIQASGSYCHIFLVDQRKITVSKNLKWFESQLTQTIFYRPHKSFLVNMNFIDKLQKTSTGTICMVNGENIPLSRAKKKEFITKVHHLFRHN